MKSRHSSMSGRIGSRSHDLGAELKMPSLDCDTFSSEEKVAVVVTVSSVEVAGSEAMLAQSLYFVIEVSD